MLRIFDVSLVCAWTNEWANNRYASDLRRLRPHYQATMTNLTGIYGFTVTLIQCIIKDSIVISIIIVSNDISILYLNRSQNRILRCTFYHIHNWRMDIIRADIVNHNGKALYKLFSVPDNMISLLPRHWFPAVASQKPTLPHTSSKNYTTLQPASRPASTSSLNIRYLYSENARVCAKWQGRARDCVTVLHDRRSRECNPVTPIECVSLSFRKHPCVLAFITYKCVQTELGWL